MNAYAYRQAIILRGAFAGDNGQEDPDAITLRITQPDGTEITKSKSDLSTSATGVWYYKFLPTQMGDHYYGFEWPGETADESSFRVKPTHVA